MYMAFNDKKVLNFFISFCFLGLSFNLNFYKKVWVKQDQKGSVNLPQVSVLFSFNF